ncbi:TraR/DksA C4-type zinc finger protein [bacterium]|nr:TraR/DksA C4-type zinc finger protein [bacterium]
MEAVRFSKRDSKYFRELILKRRTKLLRELGRLTEASKNTVQEYSGNHSTYSLHMADQGTDAQEREKTFLFASREGKYLKYLDRALRMIDDGTYGHCSECGKPIQKKRLELVPTSRLCIDCKLKEEKLRPK